MIRTLGAVLIVASLGCVSSAKAAGTNVKCAMNEDRVWVYESVVDFNLAAKLKCGEPVEIIGRVKGYVKVQTQAGVEGWVADTAFPKSALPPEPVEQPNDVQSASVAALAHHSVAPSINSKEPRTTTTAASIAPANVSPAPASATARPPQPPAVAPASAPQPVLVASAPPAPARPAPAVSAPPVAAKSQPPSIAPAAKPQPVVVASASPATAPATAASQPTEVEITLSTAPEAATAEPTPAAISARAVTASAAPAANSQPAPAPAPAPAIQPVSKNVSRAAATIANPDEDDETAVKALENENAGCMHFFSAYGLSPNQYKWLAQNRKKAFPSVCPAPTPSMVDFVVIFTHDVAFYNVTMPSAVHVDNNGFSDWTPMSTVDTALMTQSEANSSHHEYVWVFHTNRGAFDPSRFSSRRKPLFSKGETNMLGSHGGYKTVMDALTYIEENGTNR
jgi:hypothetical protein